jgi:hypothetical protein
MFASRKAIAIARLDLVVHLLDIGRREVIAKRFPDRPQFDVSGPDVCCISGAFELLAHKLSDSRPLSCRSILDLLIFGFAPQNLQTLPHTVSLYDADHERDQLLLCAS